MTKRHVLPLLNRILANSRYLECRHTYASHFRFSSISCCRKMNFDYFCPEQWFSSHISWGPIALFAQLLVRIVLLLVSSSNNQWLPSYVHDNTICKTITNTIGATSISGSVHCWDWWFPSHIHDCTICTPSSVNTSNATIEFPTQLPFPPPLALLRSRLEQIGNWNGSRKILALFTFSDILIANC